MPMIDSEIYKVSQLTTTVRYLLEDTFPLIWVEGEISNLSCPGSGHIYFSLKDSQSQVRCALFKNRPGAKLILQNGMHIIVQAKVSLYEGRGDFQLIVENVEEVGDGALQQKFEKLKQKLAAEGLFDAIHKKPLPVLPKSIGIVTSPTGAAIRDILSVLKRRFPAIPVIIYPTLVQGTGAGTQIAKMIELANHRKECDIIILTRGGGSLEDLWSFNEEIVARAIFSSELPIISGVGHEIDFTIADFVADHRAPTPSAAAELVTPSFVEYQNSLDKTQQLLQRLMESTLIQYQQKLGWLTKHLHLCHPGQRLQGQNQRLKTLEQQLVGTMQQILTQLGRKIAHAHQLLEMVNPLATLQRGYAIVTDMKGHIVRNARQVEIGEPVQTQLQEGKIVSRVEEKP